MKRWAMLIPTAQLLFAPIASVAHASSSYEMAVLPASSAAGPTYYRVNVATGQVNYITGTQFAATKDAAALPQGDYHLYPQLSPDGKTYWLYRMDAQSGRTWFLSNDSWTEVPPPK